MPNTRSQARPTDEEITERLEEIEAECQQDLNVEIDSIVSKAVAVSHKRTLEVALGECVDLYLPASKILRPTVRETRFRLTEKINQFSAKIDAFDNLELAGGQDNQATSVPTLASTNNGASLMPGPSNSNNDTTPNSQDPLLTRIRELELQIQNLSQNRPPAPLPNSQVDRMSMQITEIRSFLDNLQNPLNSTQKEKSIPPALSLLSNQQSQRKKLNNPLASKINDFQFDGTLTKYLEFATFCRENIDGDADLSEFQKFSILSRIVTNPLKAVIVNTVGPNQYQEAAKKLMSLLGDPEEIMQAYETRLRNYCNSWTAKSPEDLHRLRGMLSEARDCFEILEARPGFTSRLRDIGVSGIGDSLLRKFHSEKDNTLDQLILLLLEEARVRAKIDRDSIHRQDSNNKKRAKPVSITTIQESHRPKRTPRFPCALCDKSDHYVSACVNVLGDEAKERLLKQGLCLKCGRRHQDECHRPFVHWICNEPHLACFCPRLRNLQIRVPTASGETLKSAVASLIGTTINSETTVNSEKDTVWLVTFQARFGDSNSDFIRGLGDGGAQATVCTRDLVRRLNLTIQIASRPRLFRDPKNRELYTSREVVEIPLGSIRSPGKTVNILCYVIDDVLPVLPMPSLEILETLKEQGIYVSDGQIPELSKIEVLVGADAYYSVFPPDCIKPLADKLFIIRTILGDILHGPQKVKLQKASCLTCLSPSECICGDVRQFHGGETPEGEIETDFGQSFSKTIRYVPGRARYQVFLPWIGSLRVSSDRAMAELGVQHLRARLKRKGQLEQYHMEISKYVREGQAEKLDYVPEKAFYLPHFSVIREDKTSTKVRVVFNGSAKGKEGVSLNDTLFKGPPVHVDILKTILQFRVSPKVLIADMQKAFLQIEIAEEDRDSLCYLWFEDTLDSLPQLFRMKVLPFGLTCSPFLLGIVLEKLANDYCRSYPRAASIIKTSLYVDDLVVPFTGKEDPWELVRELQSLLALGSFSLHKFATNDTWLKVKLGIKSDEILTSCLGLRWNAAKDTISIAPPSKPLPSNQIPSKREAISWMASIFDPLGLVMPWKIQLRSLAREITSGRPFWDYPISDDQWRRLKKHVTEIDALEKLSFPRFVSIQSSGRAFADAAKLAVGGCIYFGKDLLLARGKLAAKLTMPRLELDAACLTAELLGSMKVKLGINKYSIQCFSDSKVTLGRIGNHPNRYSIFESNRLLRILAHTHSEQWSYIESKSNPADLISRGAKVSKLGKIWSQGPRTSTAPLEESSTTVATIASPPRRLLEELQQRIACSNSRGTSLRRAEALVNFLEVKFGYLSFIRRKSNIDISTPQYASLIWYKAIQKIGFKGLSLKQISKRMVGYFPYKDSAGILRAGTRLIDGNLPLNFRAPIVLPNLQLVESLVRFKHCEYGHNNKKALKLLLQEEFYIIGIKRLCERVCGNCTICSKRNRRRYTIPEAPLPRIRASVPTRPFVVVGVDYFGPVAQAKVKCYVLLFTCGSIRAVHLELVHTINFLDCMRAFTRFISYHGKPKVVYSDNAPTFKKAGRFFAEWFRAGEQFCKDNGIEWRFATPYSPWKVGMHERMVGTCKRVFEARERGIKKLNFEDTRTAVAFVQGIVNSRPLFYDPISKVVVTPGHFLIGDNLKLLPDIHSLDLNEDYLPEQWKDTIQLKRWLWNKFRAYHLTSLKRFRTLKVGRLPTIGDWVAISDPRERWGSWLVGEITELLTGSDQHARTVEVRLLNGQIRICSTRHLVPLEMSPQSTQPEIPGGEECDGPRKLPGEEGR